MEDNKIMRKDKLSSYQAKKEKLKKIKKILDEKIPQKKAWKMTQSDLITYYTIKLDRIWEIVKDE